VVRLRCWCAIACLVALQVFYGDALAQADVPGCDQLTLGTAARSGQAVDVVATVPTMLSREALPGSAFSVTQARTARPASVEKLPDADLGIIVLLMPPPFGTAPLQLKQAAREFLLQVPESASTAVLSGVAEAQVLAPLARGRAASLRALATTYATSPGQPAPGALALAETAAAGVSRPQVIVFGELGDGGQASPAAAADVTVHQLGSALPGDNADGCPGYGSRPGLITAVDALAARLTGQYRLRFDLAGESVVRIDVAGDVAQASAQLVPPTAVAPASGRSGTGAPPTASGPRDHSPALALTITAEVALALLASPVLVLIGRRNRRADRYDDLPESTVDAD